MLLLEVAAVNCIIKVRDWKKANELRTDARTSSSSSKMEGSARQYEVEVNRVNNVPHMPVHSEGME